MKFISLEPSTKKDKKYEIKFSNPDKIIHFGSRNSKTYLDHNDKNIRQNYINRHRVRENWNIVSPGSLSLYLLWGPTNNLKTNLYFFLDVFGISE